MTLRRSATRTRKPVVLVVEDHEDSRHAIAMALERAGFAVLAAEDGRRALACLDEHMPDAIVLDLILPYVTGWEILRIVRAHERLRRVPVIVVSAYYSPHKELGAVRFVAKPARMEAVLRAVSESIPAPSTDDRGAAG